MPLGTPLLNAAEAACASSTTRNSHVSQSVGVAQPVVETSEAGPGVVVEVTVRPGFRTTPIVQPFQTFISSAVKVFFVES